MCGNELELEEAAAAQRARAARMTDVAQGGMPGMRAGGVRGLAEPVEESVDSVETLTVHEVHEPIRFFSMSDTRNKYEILAPSGSVLYYARDIARRSFLRALFGLPPPWTVEVRALDGSRVLTVRRVDGFLQSGAEAFDGTGRRLGRIQPRFSFFVRRFDLLDAAGRPIGILKGTEMFDPGTFDVEPQSGGHGVIRKQWSGLVRELFSSEDTFGVSFDPAWGTDLRLLCLAATFLVDLEFFEGRRHHSGHVHT